MAKTHSTMPLIEGTNEAASHSLATSLVPEARVESPLLLKTSLPRPAALWGSRQTNLLQYSGPGEHKAMRRSALGGHPRRYLRAMTLANLLEYRAIIAPEAVSTAHRPQKQQRQQIFFREASRARTVPIKTAAIATLKCSG